MGASRSGRRQGDGRSSTAWSSTSSVADTGRCCARLTGAMPSLPSPPAAISPPVLSVRHRAPTDTGVHHPSPSPTDEPDGPAARRPRPPSRSTPTSDTRAPCPPRWSTGTVPTGPTAAVWRTWTPVPLCAAGTATWACRCRTGHTPGRAMACGNAAPHAEEETLQPESGYAGHASSSSPGHRTGCAPTRKPQFPSGRWPRLHTNAAPASSATPADRPPRRTQSRSAMPTRASLTTALPSSRHPRTARPERPALSRPARPPRCAPRRSHRLPERPPGRQPRPGEHPGVLSGALTGL